MNHETEVKQEAPERIWLIENNDPEATTETEILWSAAPSDAENDLNVEYVRADLLATVRREEREAAFKEMIGAIAVLPSQGTINYRRGYEEGVRDALRTLEASASKKEGGLK